MSSELKPITLYGAGGGPNPWKVAMILTELGLPYELKALQYGELKQLPYTDINPNGRVPAIQDPNTGITLWESGAIIEYLVDKYDKEHRFSFPAESNESYLTKQWLHFQMSGQGPYYGQAVWFARLHPEKIPSAIERYQNEIKRVTGVLDKYLEGRQYLVGDKLTYADIAFIPWQTAVPMALGDSVDVAKEFPNADAWLSRMTSRPAIAKLLADMAAARSH